MARGNLSINVERSCKASCFPIKSWTEHRNQRLILSMLHLDRQLRRASLTLFSIILFLGPKVEAALPDLVSLIRSGSGGRIVGSDAADTGVLKLERRWRRDVCELRLKNPGASPVRVHEVVLVDVAHGLRGDTPVYAEGFQMLSQTAGTLAEPRDVGGYTHRGHYRLPEPPGFRAVYGMMMVSPPDSDRILTGFTSCRRPRRSRWRGL